MLKKTIAVIITALLIAGIAGCSGQTSTTSSSSVKPVREASVASGWVVKQMELTVGAELSLVITPLNNGEEVDGYFYIEKGTDIGFQISGNSLMYQSKPTDAKTGVVTSDRFSFTATQAQGIAYTLTFKSTAASAEKVTKQTVFMEIIYPSTSTVFQPAGTK
jgi:hypothetical protein